MVHTVQSVQTNKNVHHNPETTEKVSNTEPPPQKKKKKKKKKKKTGRNQVFAKGYQFLFLIKTLPVRNYYSFFNSQLDFQVSS